MLQTYRKVTTIKAEQFDETAEAILSYNIIPKARFISVAHNEAPWLLPTKEGYMSLKKGDWIATGVDGEHWAIANDIFKRTYERVGGNS